MGRALQAVATVPADGSRARPRRLAVGIAVFIAGAVLLGLEIAASRVLAPYFGNSLFVWGALIGVVLAGLSIGYYARRALADRHADAAAPARRAIALGALLVLAIPFVDEPVLEQVVDWDPGPRLNPLVAAVALFGLPSVVLGAVSPIAVRLSALARSSTLGRTAGRLFALSTAGTIAGTFVTAFWLIPELGTDQLLAVGAAVLLAAAALVAAGQRLLADRRRRPRRSRPRRVGALGRRSRPSRAGGSTAAAAQNWSPVYRMRGEQERRARGVGLRGRRASTSSRKDTRYHRLAVVEDEETRYLRFDSSFQSAMYLDDPFATRFDVHRLPHLGLAYRPGARSGALRRARRRLGAEADLARLPGRSQLQAVELDPRSSRRRVPVVRAAAQPAARTSRSTTAAAG